MSEEALNEFEALQSIYDGEVFLLNPTTYEIDVSNDVSKDTKLRVDVGEDPISPYPLSPPSLTISAPWMARDKKKIAEEKLREVYNGDECVLECVELLKELAEQTVQLEEVVQRREQEMASKEESEVQKRWQRDLEIFQGESMVVKKSKFIAHCAIVNSVDEVNYFKSRILESKKYEEATHNILAYRFPEHEVRDDDGETGAGDKLLNFLQSANITNVAVIVTRWYGKIPLGPQRFRCIVQAASTALQKAGLASVSSKGMPKP
uniref:RWD domain-containing protein n=1 Tax=Paramoeba aestuarina TaxID=180227 RepID=A0A7S4P2E6_9EUKA